MSAEIVERPDHVEVVGRSSDDVEQALALLDAARGHQADLGREFGRALLLAMTDAGMPALPPALAAAAQRLAAHKQRLLDAGVFTYGTLGAVRGAQEAAVRTWVSRERSSLLLIKDSGRVLLPAVQFDDGGVLRPEVASMVRLLRDAGLDGWQLWSWLVSPTGLLSGQAPADVAANAPDRAHRAAERYAAELARRRQSVVPAAPSAGTQPRQARPRKTKAAAGSRKSR